MKGVTDGQFKKLVAEVKKNPGMSERHYVEVTGIAQGQILAALVKAEVEADPSLKIKATGAQIVNARDKEGLRWPRIAARAGVSVTEAKRLYEEHTGKDAADSYTGRGRNWGNGASGATAAKTTTSGGKSAGRGAGRGTSGRRAAAAKATGKAATATAGRGRAAAGRGAGRARTRADRAAKSGDPK